MATTSLPARHGDPDVERRLVARVVVGREPPGRHVRLVHGDDLVAVGQPVALALRASRRRVRRRTSRETRNRAPFATGVAGVIRSSWSPVGAEAARAGRPRSPSGPAAGSRGRSATGPGWRVMSSRGPAGEPPGAERVAVADVVVQHVDAAVAVLREVGVPDPHRTRCRGPLRGRGDPAPASTPARASRTGTSRARAITQETYLRPDLIGCRFQHRPAPWVRRRELPGAPREEAEP